MLKLVNWSLCRKEKNSTLRLKDLLPMSRYFFNLFLGCNDKTEQVAIEEAADGPDKRKGILENW